MNEIINNLKICVAILGGVLGWFLGEIDSLFYSLIVFVVLDYITGVLLAICEKKISSEAGFKGISKKVMIFVLVGLGNVIDQYIIGAGNSLKTMIIMFYLSNEGISILENASNTGLPLPQKLKDVLRQLSNTDE